MARGYFRTADLFAGCGGMTLGFHRARYRCLLAVEQDDAARQSHELNFAISRAKGTSYKAFGDITSLKSSRAVRHLRALGRSREVIDVIIGGPPCQAFSRLGRAALWKIHGKKHAHAEDSRATLYEHFLSYVEELCPIAFVMENVPEMGRFHGTNVAEEIALAAEDLGYNTRYALLNAAWYGVPQFRERMFIVGIRHELGITPSFPPRTHASEIPDGYMTSRAGRMNNRGLPPILAPHEHWDNHALDVERRHRAVTVREALRDLPSLVGHLQTPVRVGKITVVDLDTKVVYQRRASGFSSTMRNWPQFSSNGGCDGHLIRNTPRDFPIFRIMKEGDRYPDAIRIAEQIFVGRLKRLESRLGRPIGKRTKKWKELRAAVVPPYPVDRFPDKYNKLRWDGHSSTVPAHLGKDCYSHIHPDGKQERTISIREAARLQSFPDGFTFFGGMGQRFTQIGNAVPPLLALAVASHLRAELRRVGRQLQRKQ
jgi:DNA (cytosine-5)-methyltransferase 1